MHRDRTADKATAKLRLDEMEPVKRLLLLPRITLRHWAANTNCLRILVEPNIKRERAIQAARTGGPTKL